MKPIRLEIEGINSYEKKQVIDFGNLISRGIFGIFGKTGSGKSTILDAITLALYGNIARGSTGFINSNVSDGLVYFRFELGNGGKRETYEVIRKFKKVVSEDKISAKSGSVKLLKINEFGSNKEVEVLADKVKEVNNKIYEILGLTESDFLKSVVLPQGKFSEFLLLNGKSKRDMLERIFGLEEYGTNLAIKLASKKKKVENEIDILRAKLGEFSEVTDENIEKLTEKSNELKNTLNEFEKNIEKEQNLLNEYREINSLNLEKEKFSNELLELNSKKDLILDYEKKIEESRKVLDIVIEIYRKIELENDLKVVLQEGISLKEDFKKITEKFENTKRIFNNFSESKNKIPEIKTANILVKAIYENEEELSRIIFNAKQLSSAKSSLFNSIEGLKEKILKMDADIEKINSSILDNKKIESENSISMEFRNDVETVCNLEREFEILVKNKKELVLKHNTIKSEIEKLVFDIDELRKKLDDLINEISNKESEFKDLKNFQLVNEIRLELYSHREGRCSCPVCGNEIKDFNFETTKEDRDLIEKLIVFNDEIELLNKLKNEINSDLIKAETLFTEKNKYIFEIEENILKVEKNIANLSENLSFYNNKYGIKEFREEKEKIQISDKILLEVRDKNLELDKNLEEIKALKNQNEKELNAKLLDLDMVDNRYTENHKKFERILSEVNSNLIDLDYNSYIELLGFKDRIQNLRKVENLEEIVIKKDIDVLRNLYDFSNSFCDTIDYNFSNSKNELDKIENHYRNISEKYLEKQGQYKTVKSSLDKQKEKTNSLILKRGFSSEEEVKKIKLSDDEVDSLTNFIEEYNKTLTSIQAKIVLIDSKLDNRVLEINKLEDQEEKYLELSKEFELLRKESIETNLRLDNMIKDIEKVKCFTGDLKIKEKDFDVINQLEKILKGKKFVEFLSKVYLKNIVLDASRRLDSITNGRYTLEIDSEYSFVVSDNINGGIRRAIDTLSGGEIFLTSLSLALSLSTQIQLKGSAPLEFFFLDEGFGTLDRELLEIVMESLEKLHSKNLSVGVISHVDELKNRIPTKLIVEMDKEKLTSVVNIEYS